MLGAAAHCSQVCAGQREWGSLVLLLWSPCRREGQLPDAPGREGEIKHNQITPKVFYTFQLIFLIYDRTDLILSNNKKGSASHMQTIKGSDFKPAQTPENKDEALGIRNQRHINLVTSFR